jgi:hypothetical protein
MLNSAGVRDWQIATAISGTVVEVITRLHTAIRGALVEDSHLR